MRKNCRDVLEAWKVRKRHRAYPSIWTDGYSIFSYNTCLYTRGTDGRVIRNATKYSRTTSTHQHSLLVYIQHTHTVEARLNATALDLVTLATKQGKPQVVVQQDVTPQEPAVRNPNAFPFGQELSHV